MNIFFKKIKNKLDLIAIFIGALALVLSLFGVNCVCLVYFAGFICLVYALYALYLFFVIRPKFDWHLIHGHFLRKVIAFVLLVPSFIASCYLIYNAISECRGETLYSPKNLVYDENWYKYDPPVDSIGPNIFWAVYFHFIDPGNQHMTTSQSGRGFSAIIAILGVFLLNGLLVSSIVGWIDLRKENWLKGEIKYPSFLRRKEHYIIIGGNDIVIAIVKQIISKRKYILIQTSNDVESFRRELFSNLTLTEEQQKLIIIYYGNRTSEEDIKSLCLEKAEEVYIIGEEIRTDDLESYHDTMNMECLELIYGCYKNSKEGMSITRLLDDKKNVEDELSRSSDENKSYTLEERKKEIEEDLKAKQLCCRVLIEFQTTFSVFQFYDLDKERSCFINFRPFNYYEMWAQKVFVNKEINSEKLKSLSHKEYLPLEGYDGIKKEDSDYVHLFIVGMSRMGVAMAIEAAHLAHYPNYTEENKIRTKITFIDKNAAEEKNFFMGRFKELFSLSHYRYGEVGKNDELVWYNPHIPSGMEYLGGDFLDIEWEFINGGIERSSVQNYILETAECNARITIAICLPESNRSHASALYLNKKIYESESVKQVLVYNRYGDSVIKSFSSKEERYPFLNKLKAFGAPNDCVDVESMKQSEEIGNAIGQRYDAINKLYIEPAKLAANQVDTKVNYKGKSQVAKFFSNIYNGNMMWTKLRSVQYKGDILLTEQISILSDVEHNRWNIEQLLMNFRPLTEKEQSEVIAKKEDKEILKGKMAHLNICSNKRLAELKEVDVAPRAYDEGLTAMIPEIYSQLTQKQ